MEITGLWAEASGRFHVARYLGLDSQQPPGYQHVDYAVHLGVWEASEVQITRLRHLCETGSPVGDTLTRPGLGNAGPRCPHRLTSTVNRMSTEESDCW